MKEIKYPDSADYMADIKEVDISEFEKYFPNAHSQAAGLAESILHHHFNIFGIEKDFGNPINWHLDPKTSNSWPLKFWGDINYRDAKSIGGIKFAWELNRLHHLPRLAIAYSLTKNSRYRDEIFEQLDSWIKSNPYPKGINWIMGIELGIRIVNLIYTLKLLGDEQPLARSQRKLIGDFVWLHGKHLYRYLSRYTSGANHAIAEALGLFAAGLCFPSIKASKKWKLLGKEVIEKEVIRQIYPDGSSFEHSIPYLQFILDHLLVYYLLCREHREYCSPEVEDRLRSSFNFLSSILDKNGNFPIIGDDDDGYLLKLWLGSHNNLISLLNTGAILLDCSAFILENARLDQKTFILLGNGSIQKWAELRKNKTGSKQNSRYFVNAGLAVIRDNDQGKNILFVGNCGPLGLMPMASHGHADALSFWVSVDGKPMMIDPGTYVYHGGGLWRTYFRSTSAHNTIKIDGLDQSKIISEFMFDNFYKILDADLKENEEGYLWTAGHDGYMKIKDPVFHRRNVLYKKREKLIVIDDHLTCRKSHSLESFYHFHPYFAVTRNGQYFLVEGGKIRAKILVDQKWPVREIVKGCLEPLLGWYSPKYNHLEETYTLRLSSKITGNESFRTIIFLN